MPQISHFYGITIYMFTRNEHNPPHFHAKYQDSYAAFTIDGELMEGELPPKQKKLVVAWAALHQEELLLNWKAAMSHQEPQKIRPLQ